MNATVHKTSAFDARHHQDEAKPTAKRLPPDGDTICLNTNQFAHVHGANGWTVRALEGRLWITQDGDLRDVVLEAGQSFTLDRGTSALISPLGDACLRLSLENRSRKPYRSALPSLLGRLRPALA